MKIETNRLELIPLTAVQLRMLAEDLPKLEQELNCSYQAEEIDGDFGKIVKYQVNACNDDPDNYYFHTFWLILRKSDRVVVGSIDFKNLPNDKGEVEIGYGLGKQNEHNGYMTETVQAFCQWGLQQPGVRDIIAETVNDNLPSQRVLTRCNFAFYEQKETMWWRLQK